MLKGRGARGEGEGKEGSHVRRGGSGWKAGAGGKRVKERKGSDEK